jgi:hypothetical protein
MTLLQIHTVKKTVVKISSAIAIMATHVGSL